MLGKIIRWFKDRWRLPEFEFPVFPYEPSEEEEDELASLDMHYGDEPLYYSDPPKWPYQ